MNKFKVHSFMAVGSILVLGLISSRAVLSVDGFKNLDSSKFPSTKFPTSSEVFGRAKLGYPSTFSTQNNNSNISVNPAELKGKDQTGAGQQPPPLPSTAPTAGVPIDQTKASTYINAGPNSNSSGNASGAGNEGGGAAKEDGATIDTTGIPKELNFPGIKLKEKQRKK